MTYKITGLDSALIDRFRGLDEAKLEAMGARRMVATAKPGFPCRTTLEDAEPGESLILFHHTSHDVDTPYRSAYAIFIREQAGEAARYVDAVPPVMQGRPLALRCFDADGMLKRAALAAPGAVDQAIREQLAHDDIAYIDVHNAAYGCFAARVERA